MFSLFNKKEKQKHHPHNAVQEQVAMRIVKITIGIQERFAAILNSKAESLSSAFKKILLIAFCIVSSAFCIYSIRQGFAGHEPQLISITTIRFPNYAGKDYETSMKPQKPLLPQYYQHVHLFHYNMDSLAQTLTSRRKRDSFNSISYMLTDSSRISQDRFQIQSLNK